MSLLDRIKDNPDLMQRVYAGVMLLGTLLGKTKRAESIIVLLATIPGRVEAVDRAKAKLEAAADEVEAGFEAGTMNGQTKISVEMTAEEIDAYDDWLDLQSKGSRELRKLAKRLLGKKRK